MKLLQDILFLLIVFSLISTLLTQLLPWLFGFAVVWLLLRLL